MQRVKYVIFYWLILALIIPNIVLCFTDSLTTAGAVANVLLPLGVIGLVACVSDRLGVSAALLVPFMLFGAFQLVLSYLYGYGVITVDMFRNIGTTNPSEAAELLDSLLPALSIVALLYVVPLVLYAIVSRYNPGRLNHRFVIANRKVFAAIAFAGVLVTAGCYMQSDAYAMQRDMFPVNAVSNMVTAAKRTVAVAHHEDISSDYHYNARATHDPDKREVYLLVIGETSRAENWELDGYGRHTNPKLSKRREELLSYDALSESNVTYKSVPMLLSPVNATTYHDGIYKTKSLLTAFKEAGFSTAFLSSQQPNHSIIQDFGAEADTTVYTAATDSEGNTGDFTLLPPLREVLSHHNLKQLIVLHTYGSHFNYSDRYGTTDRIFTPDGCEIADHAHRAELVNAYDNSIVATDRLLDEVISLLDAEDCQGCLLYASDHGEDLYDDNHNLFLHSSPRPTIHQLRVPFLIWLSPEYTAANPEVTSTLQANESQRVSSSRSYCATGLDIAGIATPRSDSRQSLASADYRPTPAVFLDDNNNAKPLRQVVIL